VASLVYDFSDSVVVVTGAGRGLGRAIAQAFGAAGATVVVSDLERPVDEVAYDVSTRDDLTTTARMVEEAGGRALAVSADVSSEADVVRMTATALEEFGRIDILVNNAGVLTTGPLIDTDESKWDVVIDVNLKGPFLCCKHAARHMIERGEGGRLITVASTAGLVAVMEQVAYVSSKHGAVGQMRALALELGRFGITANAVCPGTMHTPMFDAGFAAQTDAARERVLEMAGSLTAFPGIHAVDTSDTAGAVMWLASDAARYITGIALPVDGGFTAK
jgi:NAD(P)-dependent dehydrogenase (short-subunit alcohol dehydrogenase family)